MRHFKTISIIFIALIAVIFSCNVFYLVSLYRSIRIDVERDVMTAMADADIDDMWERSDRANRAAIAAQKAAAENGDSIYSNQRGGISGVKDPDGNFVTTAENKNGTTTVSTTPLRRDRSYTNQMVNEMSQQMHVNMDPFVDFNLAVMDSILMQRLADRHIHPDFLAVEVVNSKGKIIRGNAHTPKSVSDYDVFSLCFNPESDMYYRAYMTPLTRQIFSEMAGVVVTIFLLMLVFALAFIYLFRTVSRMRTLEEMKDDFVGNMTHELKTPIAIAYSANDALINYDADSDPSKRINYLRIANRQLKRLEQLVEGILAMSMERRRTMKLKLEQIQLASFVEEIAVAQRLRTEKEILINVRINDSITVTADRTHLANIICNLIDNSIKYSGNAVVISITADSDCITIADNGIGIPPKSLSFIFDKFYRVPHGNRQDVKGYGIGLYYVKSIISKMGWAIDVKSVEGEGAEFTIRFNKNKK